MSEQQVHDERDVKQARRVRGMPFVLGISTAVAVAALVIGWGLVN